MSIGSIGKELKRCYSDIINGKTVNNLKFMKPNGLFRTVVKATAVAFVAGILPLSTLPSTIISVTGFALGLSYFARQYYTNREGAKDSYYFSPSKAMLVLVRDLVESVKRALSLKSA